MKLRLVLIILAFCVSFVAMVGLSLYSMGRFSTLISYSNLVDKASRVVIDMRSAEVKLRDVALAERGYVITLDTAYLSRFRASVDSTYQWLDSISLLVHDNPEQQRNLALLKGIISQKVAAGKRNIAFADSTGSSSRSRYYDDSRNTMAEATSRLREMRHEEGRLLEAQSKGEQYFQQLTNDTLKYLLLVFCVINLVLFIMMIKEFRGRVIYQEELQARLMDLRRSHAELEEIAYAASHDLQEPLRKIQVFSNMLVVRKGELEGRAMNDTLLRISNAAQRMQSLITDLMHLTNLTRVDEKKQLTDLNKIIRFCTTEMDQMIREKNATIEARELPTITGCPNQLQILFCALLDNALKFSRAEVPPLIQIYHDLVNGEELASIHVHLRRKSFHRISVSDNGIGFDEQFVEKMFHIFQQLHSHEDGYSGRGIGLAICQRIMANHDGYIVAHGEPGTGARLLLFFPAGG